MKKQTTQWRAIKFTAIIYVIAILGIIALVNACNKSAEPTNLSQVSDASRQNVPKQVPAVQGHTMTGTMTVANMRPSADGNTMRVMFNENEEIFNVQDAGIIAALKAAFSNNKPVQISFNPWNATISNVSAAAIQDVALLNSREVVYSPGTAHKIDLASMSNDIIDNIGTPQGIAPVNTTTTGLTNVIPDFATAQVMFDYIAHQCCALPGPYGVSYCITFQYCEDGCYARAQVMCRILNNRYHYGTQKVFSFANDAAGVDELCVQAQKWGGCCVNWWYHVAPLLTIQTTTGPKAYVFDPAMFDQPVLLSTWLHGQENPACVPTGDVPHVTMINVQPTSSYEPTNNAGTTFNTDPLFTNTDATLVNYRSLTTCP